MKISIFSTSLHVPEKKILNSQLPSSLNTSDAWIFSHTGIRSRFIATQEKASDLAVLAGKKALQSCNLKPSDIDLLVIATSTPDYLSFPSTACVVQNKLNIPHCIAYDISAACTGFVYAFSVATNAIRCEEAKTALVIGSEIFSKIVNWEDRSTCVLFGDGAGAVIISSKYTTPSNDVLGTYLSSDANNYKCLIRDTLDGKENTNPAAHVVQMDGKKVYDFAVYSLVHSVQKLAEKYCFSLEEIDYIVPHQANKKIITAAAKRLGMSKEKFFINIDTYANTSAASIPIALAEMVEKNILKKGMKIILAGFGAGLTYGGILLQW